MDEWEIWSIDNEFKWNQASKSPMKPEKVTISLEKLYSSSYMNININIFSSKYKIE